MSTITKEELRVHLRKSRGLLTRDQIELHSAVMTARLVEFIDWRNVKKLHCYMASQSQNEPETWPFLEYVWQNYPQAETFVPVIQGRHMSAARVHAHTQWQAGRFSIPEPIAAEPAEADTQYDIVIVPLLGFNSGGYRIGYGGGYYDRFLVEQSHAQTVGFCYEAGHVEFDPEPHDIPLNVIVTEESLRKYG